MVPVKALGLALALGVWGTSAFASETYVVAVGVEKYDDAGVSAVSYAVADAKAIAAAFERGGVPRDHIEVLTTDAKLAAKRPTRRGVLDAINHICDVAVEGDTAVIFFAGHGMLRKDEAGRSKTYWLACDTDPKLVEDTALPYEAVRRALTELYDGTNVLMLVDACRNDPAAGRGEVDATLGEDQAREMRPRVVARPNVNTARTWALLMACSVNERAWPWVEKGHGVFTWFLLEAMQGQAAAENRTITPHGIAKYLKKQIPAWAQRKRKKQWPTYDCAPTMDNDFTLFALPVPAPPVPPRMALPVPLKVTPKRAMVAPPMPIPPRQVAKFGELELITELPEVQVAIEGRRLGVVRPGTALKHKALPGPLRLSASAPDGYLPGEQTVEVRAGESLKVVLRLLAWPVLVVTTELPEVTVEIDGQPAGRASVAAPYTTNRLAAGEHQVRVTAPGWLPVEARAKLTVNEQTRLALSPLSFPSLAVDVTEVDVELEVDGQAQGRHGPANPLALDHLEVGTHVVKGRLGPRASELTVTLRAGERARRQLVLPAGATVQIELTEPGLGVDLDTDAVRVPANARTVTLTHVPAGPHTLTVRSGTRQVSVPFEAKDGGRLTFRPALPVEVIGVFRPVGTLEGRWGVFLPAYLDRWRSKLPGNLRYRVRPKDGMPQVEIPAGEFLMGGADAQGPADERPQKRVRLTAFYIDLHPVTLRQFRQFLTETGRSFPADIRNARSWQEDDPMVSMSWHDAQDYASWAGGALPTEAQWEKAARGGVMNSEYQWSEPDPRGKGHFSEQGRASVARSAPNGYGLFDLTGNIRQWCRDSYQADWYAAMPAVDPVNAKDSGLRVVRGAAWNGTLQELRVAHRSSAAAQERAEDLGLRLVSRP